jgi:hypothetical protein
MLIALAPTPLAADPADIAAASRSVVRVVLIDTDGGNYTLIGHGSGFAVGPNLVVTNAHVVASMAGRRTMRLGIVPSQGKSGYFAKLVAYAPKQDLALLQLTEPGNLVPATLFTGAVTDGEDVWAIGYPGNVDAAQGYSERDLMSPSAPVKTHGTVSAGRNGHGFDSVLHTAQLAAGNSGGPLLDACGRVIGANSFGTDSASGADSAFYFAVSMREISRFLLTKGVKPALTGEPCQSLAAYQSAQDQLLAGEKASADDHSRAEQARRDAALQSATRKAEQDVITARENHMALAGIALLAAIASGSAGLFLKSEERPGLRKLAAIGSVALLIGALIAWFSRPSIVDIVSRAQMLVASGEPSESPEAANDAPPQEGAMICVIDTTRSRITVSQTTDVPLNWRADGCVNNKTQYGLPPSGWTRILAPQNEDTVSVATYDPASRTYRTDRYLLDEATMTSVRASRTAYSPPLCGGGEDAARKLGESQAAVLALLPPQPNERLVYRCTKQP